MPGNIALSCACPHPAVGSDLVSPTERLSIEPSARSELPLGLAWQVLADPGRIGNRVIKRNVGNRVSLATVQLAAEALRVAPLRTSHPRPPVLIVGQVDRPRR